MKTFQRHLEQKVKDKNFKILFEEEKQILELAIAIVTIREKQGLTQGQLALMTGITQQQLSKLENGANCNLTTLLKVCNTLDLKLDVHKRRPRKVARGRATVA